MLASQIKGARDQGYLDELVTSAVIIAFETVEYVCSVDWVISYGDINLCENV